MLNKYAVIFIAILFSLIRIAEAKDFPSKTPAGVIADFTFSPDTIYTGTLVTFASTATSTVYPILNRWNWGDASDSVNTGANTITHTYYSPGIYQVRLIVENTNNERDTVLKNLLVLEVPFNNLTADFSYSPTTIYEGNNVQFTDMSAISTGTIDSWLWSIDGGFTFYTGQNFTYTFTNAGNYTILHKVISSLGDIDTISKLITVLPASAPIANFSAPDSIYISASVQFINTSSSSGIIVAFSWDFGDGMQGSFLQNPVHTYALAGVYAVRLIVIDNLGQGDTVTKMIRVLPPAGVQIKALCPAVDSTQLFCYFPGANYQWQLSTDSGITFSNISDNTYYIGSNERFIQLKNIPSSWAGYQYRCIAGSNIDVIYKIVFTNLFTGNGDNTWENPANWNCGNLPDANTDIVIPAGSTVVLNSNASCRTITVSPGASFTINPGFTLTITH